MVKKKIETSQESADDNLRKRKRVIPTRQAGAPVKAFANPADDLFAEAFAARDASEVPAAPAETDKTLVALPFTEPEKPKVEKLTPPSMVSTVSKVVIPSRATPPRHGQSPIAPLNNFQKVTNTITREAIPQGLFKAGKSKQVYDVLYSLTRGAISPTRNVRISKPKLRSLSGVGARTTMDACLAHLEHVGLIRQNIHDGGHHEGNEYEVFTPEEISTSPTMPSQGKQGFLGEHGEQGKHANDASNLSGVGSLVSGHARQGQEPMSTGEPTEPNTIFKTIKNDDELALGSFLQIFSELSRKLTGRDLKVSDEEKWKSFAEVIALEIEIAAKRTQSVSSLPAFAAEHFRRRLFSQPRASREKNRGNSKGGGVWTQVGKSDYNESTGEYLIKPLDEKGREEAFAMLREMKEIEVGIDDFEKWYTLEDWKWLMENLENNSSK